MQASHGISSRRASEGHHPSLHAPQRAEPRTRRFARAPESLAGFVAAMLEPGIAATMLVVAHIVQQAPFTRASMVLALLALTLTFPGSARFRDPPATAAIEIAVAWAWLLALLLVCGNATDSLDLYDRGTVALWAITTPVVHWLAVLGGRMVLQRLAHSAVGLRRAVIVGGGPLAARTAQSLQAREDNAAELLGFFDDRGIERLDPATASRRLGTLADVARHVKAHAVDEVYITLPLGSQPRIAAVLESLQATTASIYLVPDVFGISVIQGRLQDLGGLPVVGLCETPFTGVNAAVKRSSDIVLAAAILALVAPLLLLIAAGVKASSPGPVVFRQRRNGLRGEEIVVYKFRTMRTMEDGDAVRQATRDDGRITRFGALLRRTSLDELPQFVNVLQGRMSIVGPRPHAVAHNRAYGELIKAYTVRHKVRPGITGWAQVNGHRGETETIDKMRWRVDYDLEYLRNWSLALDLRIIMRTIRLVFVDRTAR